MRVKKTILDHFKKLDRFGQSVDFTLGGDHKYRTSVGAFFSLVVTIVVGLQFMKKFDILIQRGDTNHMNTVEYGENSGDIPIGYKETGYNFAFGILPN